MQLSIIYNHTKNTYPPEEFTQAFRNYTEKCGLEATAQTLDISVHTVKQLMYGKYIPSRRMLSNIKTMLEKGFEPEHYDEPALMDIVAGNMAGEVMTNA